MTGDWATVHWTATIEDGRVVSDSRAEPGGRPKHFTLGDHQVFSCWDIAIPQLKEGSVATLHCPSFYAWGGAHTLSPLGGDPIPLHSDVDFQIEVVECNRVPVITRNKVFQITNDIVGTFQIADDGTIALGRDQGFENSVFKMADDDEHIEPTLYQEAYSQTWSSIVAKFTWKFDAAGQKLFHVADGKDVQLCGAISPTGMPSLVPADTKDANCVWNKKAVAI